MDIKVKSIEIQVGKKTLTLTIEEAKELQAALNEAFPAPSTGPWWSYTFPNTVPVYSTGTPLPEYPIVTCGTVSVSSVSDELTAMAQELDDRVMRGAGVMPS